MLVSRYCTYIFIKHGLSEKGIPSNGHVRWPVCVTLIRKELILLTWIIKGQPLLLLDRRVLQERHWELMCPGRDII